MRVALRRLRPDEFEAFAATSTGSYAHDLEANGGLPADEAVRKARCDFSRLFPNGLAPSAATVFVIEDDGESAGHLFVAERELDGRRTLFVYGLWVDERYRGRRLGRRAMELCEEEARSRGLDRVDLNVFGGNEAARGLYRSLGFRELAISMGKEL